MKEKTNWPFGYPHSHEVMEYDTKNRYDRVGDQIFNYHMRNVAMILLSAFIALMAYVLCHQFQDYLQSFHRTVAEARAPFTKIEKVPSWTISFNYNN